MLMTQNVINQCINLHIDISLYIHKHIYLYLIAHSNFSSKKISNDEKLKYIFYIDSCLKAGLWKGSGNNKLSLNFQCTLGLTIVSLSYMIHTDTHAGAKINTLTIFAVKAFSQSMLTQS